MTVEIHSILIMRRGLLGDSVVAVPAMVALRRAYPGAVITLVSERDGRTGICWGEEIFGKNGWVDRVVGFDGYNASRVWRKILAVVALFRLLGFRRWDLGICLDLPRNVGWEPLLLRFLGVGRVLRPQKGLDDARDGGGILRVSLPARDQLLKIVPPLGPAFLPYKKEIHPLATAEEERNVERWLNRQTGFPFPHPWVAVAPWANMPAKEWPLERYREVIKSLRRRQILTPILVGGARDEERGRAFLASVGGGVLAAGLSVREMWALLRQCALFLGNDSGPMHLADSAGVPCVALFSGRDALGVWEPTGPEHVVFRRRLACEGCMLVDCQEKRKECLTGIPVSDVVRACFSRLSPESGWPDFTQVVGTEVPR